MVKPFEKILNLMFIQAKDKLLIRIPITDNLSVRYLGLMYKNNCKPCGLELSLAYLQAAAPGLSTTIDRTFRRRESTVPLSSLQQLFGVTYIWTGPSSLPVSSQGCLHGLLVQIRPLDLGIL